ncbi:putative Type I site-specific deoxyribonuclease [Vibrio jasicida]|uniref:Type I site-specific deoxyribonuclease n=1 Tax=Vibrio jasicida TaxID=766224 RepID=A0AAU9QW57_9VIBR|nr:putative Type I site-specific deoxyribonuclease [Vibrio jasicida]CAH1602051.1 putative Type I site-specific deoxyribonuclease [Vibrio jasicida]
MEQVLYKLPDGWEWSNLTDICTPSRKTVEPNPEEQYNYIGLENIESHTGKLISDSPTKGSEISSTKVSFKKGMVLYGKLRPYLNKVVVAKIDGIATTEIIPFECSDAISPGFLAYYLRSQYFVDLAMNNCSGARMPRATTKLFTQIAKVPVTSITEQNRIVEKLDALLTRIDTAIEHWQESVTLADALYASTINEQMMQAIELAGLSTVEKHIEQIQTGTTPPTKQPEFYENGDINWFAPSDFGDHDILFDSNKKLSQKAFDAGKARKFDAGTIMLVAIGATIGKIGYLEQDASSNQQITGMKFNSAIIPRYAYYWFRFIKPEILTNASTATLPIINQKGIKALSFCAPNKQLQETICRKIDEVSNFRNKVKAELNEKVELMRSLKASILDSAFKGEL